MKKYLILAMVFILFITLAYATAFKQVGFISEGQFGDYGFIRAFDTNHNSKKELTFLSNKAVGNSFICDYEYSTNNQYTFLDTIAFYVGTPWSIGYLDDDSLVDLIIEKRTGDTIFVFESPAFDSCPTNKVWGGDRYY